MRLKFPGLLKEKHRNGSIRWRVRVEGDTNKRISIPVGPDHRDFYEHYYAAREGREWAPAGAQLVERSLDWLVERYLDWLAKMVESGQRSELTLSQRGNLLKRMCDHQTPSGDRYGSFDMDAPQSAFVELRDAWADRAATADNTIKAVRSMYAWAIERGEIGQNPASGIAKIHRTKNGGATPWTAEDLRQFKKRHPKGSTAHLWLTLQAFTACRIGDAIWLGRDNEATRGGVRYLEWQPRKKGSAPVSIPMLPPLYEATRAVNVIGPSYLLTERGIPFKSAAGLGKKVRDWVSEAGLDGRSSHGVRKAVAELMAESGSSDHQIMSVLAHTQAQTSAVYTKGARRRILALSGMDALRNLDW